MTLRELFGLESLNISDMEIMARIKQAFDKEQDIIEFVSSDGKKIIVRLPKIDFARHIDPWDGKTSAVYTKF